jgi:ribosomal protein S18 acetylase RimI-like enzyme
MKLELDLEIRPATVADLDQLEWFGHQRHLRPHIDEILDRRTRGEAELLVAVVNDFAVGRLGIDFTRIPDAALLWSFAVIPNLQRLGIGTALTHAAEEIARTRGFSIAEIEVDKRNVGARALYERLGYAVTGERQGRWSYVDDRSDTVVVEDDDWVLRKRL